MSRNSSAVRNLPYVRNFEEAQALFDKTRLPRSKHWREHQRPLYNTVARHYRLERNAHSFDVVLYSTPMARYYAPRPDGSRVVFYHGHDSTTTSKNFRYNVLGVGWAPQFRTTDGVLVKVPITGSGIEDPMLGGKSFGAKLTFDKDNRLIVAESDHAPLKKIVSSAEDTERRKAVKQKVQDAVTLAVMRMPEYAESAKPNVYDSKPFRGNNVHYMVKDSVRKIVADPAAGTTDDYNRFFEFAGEVYETLLGKRAYKATYEDSNFGYRYANSSKFAQALNAVQHPSEDEFRRSLEGAILRTVGADRSTGRELLPKFMPAEDFPTNTANLRYY